MILALLTVITLLLSALLFSIVILIKAEKQNHKNFAGLVMNLVKQLEAIHVLLDISATASPVQKKSFQTAPESDRSFPNITLKAPAVSAKTAPLKTEHTQNPALLVPDSPHRLCLLNIGKSLFYNPHGTVIFNEASKQEDALLELYSDMTVAPTDIHFRGYNSHSYFTNKNLHRVFNFQDQYGNDFNGIYKPLKCLKVIEHAIVVSTANGYELSKKGTLMMEEKCYETL